MTPMNAFLTAHREEFKRFIEDVCFVPHPPALLAEAQASYSTPNAIRNRLPATSKEGFPSLPYLLDEAREYAGLVDLWTQASKKKGFLAQSNGSPHLEQDDTSFKSFQEICKNLSSRTQECLARAERAERPSSDLGFRWEELIESLQASTVLDGSSPLLDLDPAVADSTSATADEVVTPLASSFNAANLSAGQSGDRPISPSTPQRLATQLDWEAAPDGGAGAAASLLSQERNPRSGFVLTSPNLSSGPFAGRTTTTITAGIPEPGIPTAEDILADTATVVARPAPPPTISRGSLDSRPASALGGAVSSAATSDTEGATALPAVSRDRAKRERRMREKELEREIRDREKEKEKQRLKDIVGVLGRRKKEK